MCDAFSLLIQVEICINISIAKLNDYVIIFKRIAQNYAHQWDFSSKLEVENLNFKFEDHLRN